MLEGFVDGKTNNSRLVIHEKEMHNVQSIWNSLKLKVTIQKRYKEEVDES